MCVCGARYWKGIRRRKGGLGKSRRVPFFFQVGVNHPINKSATHVHRFPFVAWAICYTTLILTVRLSLGGGCQDIITLWRLVSRYDGVILDERMV